MSIETLPWRIDDEIRTPEQQRDYLEAAFEDGDPILIAAAIEDVARACGLDTAPAQESSARDPRLSMLLQVMNALGLALTIRNGRDAAA